MKPEAEKSIKGYRKTLWEALGYDVCATDVAPYYSLYFLHIILNSEPKDKCTSDCYKKTINISCQVKGLILRQEWGIMTFYDLWTLTPKIPEPAILCCLRNSGN